jgi:O-methyltransferase involved in polyketide biosynthesis
MSPEPLVRNVSDTARWVAAYRAMESARPEALFKDPFAERLEGERGQSAERVEGDGAHHAQRIESGRAARGSCTM